jgi:hypothetical protein
MRFLLGTVYISLPWNPKLTSPWYLVIERTSNVSSEWRIRLGTDDKELAVRECSKLNDNENRAALQERQPS